MGPLMRPLINTQALTTGINLAQAFNSAGVPPANESIRPQLVIDLYDISSGLHELGALEQGRNLKALTTSYETAASIPDHVKITQMLSALQEPTLASLSEMFLKSAATALESSQDTSPQEPGLVTAEQALAGLRVMLDGKPVQLDKLPPVERPPEVPKEVTLPEVMEPAPDSFAFTGNFEDTYYEVVGLLQRIESDPTTAQALSELREVRPETFGNKAVNQALLVAQALLIVERLNKQGKPEDPPFPAAVELLHEPKNIAGDHQGKDDNVLVRQRRAGLKAASKAKAKDETARSIREFLAACILDEDIPAHLLQIAVESRHITIPELQELEPDIQWDHMPGEYSDPLFVFENDAERFAEAVEAIPKDDESYKLRDRMKWFRQNRVPHRFQGSVIRIQGALQESRFAEARRGYLRFRTALLKSDIETLRQEGLHQMDRLEALVLDSLQAGEVREAEAFLNFGIQWIAKMQRAVHKKNNLEADLLALGERDAMELFRERAQILLQHGQRSTFLMLVAVVSAQVQEPLEVKAPSLRRLKRGCKAALLTENETLRSLLALTSAEERMRLAERVPSVSELLEAGPATEAAIRKKLRKLGLPLPGDAGVQALPISGGAPATIKKQLG